MTKAELQSSRAELGKVRREIAEKEEGFDERWKEREARFATAQEARRQEAMAKAGDMELWQSELNKLRVEASAIRDAISRVRSRSPPTGARGRRRQAGGGGSASDATASERGSASERETVSEGEADAPARAGGKAARAAKRATPRKDGAPATLLRPISTNVSERAAAAPRSKSTSNSSVRRGRTPTREGAARDDLDLLLESGF